MFCSKFVDKPKTTHFLFNTFNFFKNRAVFEIMWKNIVLPDRPQMTIWRMRIACRIPKATNTHSEYVMLIAFPLQQLLHERPSMLRYSTPHVLLQQRRCVFTARYGLNVQKPGACG